MTQDKSTILAPLVAWQRIAVSMAQVGLAAGEVVWRRSVMTAFGSLSLREAQQMIAEKPATLAVAIGNALTVAARGGDPATVTAAALGPYTSSTASNARRLRR